jgi:hypothetical protein
MIEAVMLSEQTFSIDLPFTDAVLRLMPRWGEFELAAQAAFLALAALVPLALIGALYRYELRLVSRAAATALLSLRVAVLGFLWFVLCLEPVLVTTTARELPTRVAIAVDVSGSMNVTDPNRPAADKLRLSRALHLPLPGGPTTPRLLDDWIRQYDKRGPKADLQWIAADESPGDPRRRRQLAGQRRALHERICADVDRLTRLEIVLRLLAADGGKLLAGLSEKHRVEILGCGAKLVELKAEQMDKVLQVFQMIKPGPKQEPWELTPEQSARLFRLGPRELDTLLHRAAELRAQHRANGWYLQPGQLDRLLRQAEGKRTAPTGDPEVTDLGPPLERGLKPSGAGQGKLVGIVLLTDGRHNAESSPDRFAEELGKRKVPVYPIVLGTPEGRPSVTLTEIQAPPSASSKNVEVTVRVRFRVTGLPKQNLVVSLERADRRPGQPKAPEPVTVAHDGHDQSYDRSFVVSLDPEGKPLQTFVVTVRPAVPLRGGNPSQPVVIKADDTKPKVLLVDGEARWEYHYLANALLRDRGLQLRRVLFSPPLLDPDISEDDLKKLGNPKRHLPAGPDALADYQCIILGDVAPEQLPRPDRERLEQFVARHGGTLVIVAGKRFTPLAYTPHQGDPAVAEERGKGAAPETDPLLKLLPIEGPHVVRPEQGFPVTLTREGRSAPFMRMEAEAGESAERWASFPPHYWGVVGRAKAAATPLAYYRDPAGDAAPGKDGDEEELKRPREQSLIVRQTYGRGQVLFVGLDSTWRWRYRAGDTYHHRFWGQVIRWASSDYTRFGTDQPVYQEGQDVTLDLSLEDREAREVPADGELKARVVRLAEPGGEDKTVALVPLSAAEGRRVLKGRVRSLPAGRYRAELDRPDPALAARLGDKPPVMFLVTPRDNKEMDHLETNEDLLRDLSRKSGDQGRVFTPAGAAEVVELLTQRAVTRVERSEHGLWQAWGTLVLLLGLLTAEWAGRKWAGLP